MNNAINDIKNTLEGTNSRITEAEDRISEVDSLSLPLLFGLVGIYPVPLPAEYSSLSSSLLYC